MRRTSALSAFALALMLTAPVTTASAADTFTPGPPTISVGLAAGYQARATRTSVISKTGRYVAFTAYVGDLVQVFRRDIHTGTTTLVSATRRSRATAGSPATPGPPALGDQDGFGIYRAGPLR